MYRKIKLITTLGLFILANVFTESFSYGQEKKQPIKENGGMGYSMFGSTFLNVSDLNTKLENSGYSTFSDNFFSAGGGGHAIINNKWIVGGEGHTLLSDSETSGNYSNSLIASYGFFDLGYIVFSIGDLRIYPIIGLGAGEMKFKISRKLTSLSFDDILDTPERNSEISKSGFLLNLSLGTDYLINFSKNENERGGMLLGVRAGYCLSPSKGHWEMGDVEISGAPDLGFSGPYIRFMIGGGGFSKEK